MRLIRRSFCTQGVTLFFALIALVSCSNALSSGAVSSSSTTKSASSSDITAIVLDSVGGSAIVGATVVVTNSSGNQVCSTTTGSDGTVSLTSYLTLGSIYSITATYINSSTSVYNAASEMVNYVATSGTTVALYCHTLGITGVSATAPTIEYVKCSVDSGSTWSTLTSGTTISGSFEIEASVLGVVAVKATSLSGFGVGIDIDQMPTSTNGYYTSSSSYGSLVSTTTDAVYDSTTKKYRTVNVFNLSGLTFLSGSHTLELVAYDVANNRVEERIPFTLK